MVHIFHRLVNANWWMFIGMDFTRNRSMRFHHWNHHRPCTEFNISITIFQSRFADAFFFSLVFSAICLCITTDCCLFQSFECEHKNRPFADEMEHRTIENDGNQMRKLLLIRLELEPMQSINFNKNWYWNRDKTNAFQQSAKMWHQLILGT